MLPLPIGFLDHPCFKLKEVVKSGYRSLAKPPTPITYKI